MTSLKTVEYAFDFNSATVATTVTRTFTSLTVDLPETGKVFHSVYLQVHLQETDATAGNLTAYSLGVNIDAVGADTQSSTVTISNSGENQGWTFIKQYTAYFNTNYTGTSHSVVATSTITGRGTNNASAKLVITYEYDESSSTQIKTIYIPIESNTGATATSLTELGTNQVPLLDTFVTEASPTFKDIFFELKTNEATSSATAPNPTLSLSLDAEGGSLDGLHEDALVSARYYHRLWKRTDMSTNATHAFKAATTTANMPFSCLGALLTVTYTFNPSSTTRVLNSVLVPLGSEPGFIGGGTSPDKSIFYGDLCIAEPGIISPKQSGVAVGFDGSAATTLTVRGVSEGNTQTYRSYSHGNLMWCGSKHIYHRLDGGSAAGNGLSLNRGKNTIQFQAFRTGTTSGQLGSFMSVMGVFNYVSDKCANSGGVARHNHTVYQSILGSSTAQDHYTGGTISIDIPDSPEYYLTKPCYYIETITPSGVVTPFNIQVKYDSTEGFGGGWRSLLTQIGQSDAEVGTRLLYGCDANAFKLYSDQPDSTKMSITIDRIVRNQYTTASINWCTAIATYHTINFTVAGVISGYGGGDGSGISVALHDATTNALLKTTTTTTGGAYTFVWYDDVHPVYTTAVINGKAGRSANGYAS